MIELSTAISPEKNALMNIKDKYRLFVLLPDMRERQKTPQFRICFTLIENQKEISLYERSDFAISA
ncbi:MAG: hypothetical protein A2X49_15145 [Lentisphaerae bacterium GWF2_52_8]|nr:MAG: hypothetical protein A2X49_15145 [Lentisphaerae bacterium GWF2_52_8]